MDREEEIKKLEEELKRLKIKKLEEELKRLKEKPKEKPKEELKRLKEKPKEKPKEEEKDAKEGPKESDGGLMGALGDTGLPNADEYNKRMENAFGTM